MIVAFIDLFQMMVIIFDTHVFYSFFFIILILLYHHVNCSLEFGIISWPSAMIQFQIVHLNSTFVFLCLSFAPFLCSPSIHSSRWRMNMLEEDMKNIYVCFYYYHYHCFSVFLTFGRVLVHFFLFCKWHKMVLAEYLNNRHVNEDRL